MPKLRNKQRNINNYKFSIIFNYLLYDINADVVYLVSNDACVHYRGTVVFKRLAIDP